MIYPGLVGWSLDCRSPQHARIIASVMSRPPPSSCPDENLLLAFAEGRLEGDLRDAVVRHLGECDACLAAVGGVADAPPLARPAPSIVTAFQPGDIVAGRYAIERFIARGGMGEVYEAADKLLGVRVALKTVLLSIGDDPRAVSQIRREVQLARAINHPGVCRVFDIGEHVVPGEAGREAKRFFLTMEFLDGSTLGQRVHAGGPLDGELFLALARQLADGLAAAHAAGVIHRDFKSDNVMLLPATQGGFPRAVIMDFGLARGGQGSTTLGTTGGIMVGSAAYMAPEQVEGGPVREPADIYAYGVVLFEAATGRLPFLAPTAVAMATKRLFEAPPAPRSLVATLDARIEQIILRCMARQPGDRFPSMSEVRSALAGLEASAPLVGEAAPQAPPVQRPLARGLPWALVIAGIAVTASVLLARMDWGADRGRSPVAAPTPLPASPTSAATAAPPQAAPPPAASPPPASAQTEVAPPPQPPPVAEAVTVRKETARPPVVKIVRRRSAPPVLVKQPEAPAPPAAKASGPDSRSQSSLDGFANPFR
jgi:hypothetical protein